MNAVTAELLNYLTNEAENLMNGIELRFDGGFRGLLAAADGNGYRPTMRADLDSRFDRLADIYDAAQQLRGVDARAYRG